MGIDTGGKAVALGDEVEQPVLDHAQAASVGKLAREAAEPGVLPRLVREHVLEDPRALALLLAPQHGLRRARPSGQHAEGVADPEEGRGLVALHRVEEREGGLFPRGILVHALAPLGHPVVLPRVDVAGTAGPHVDRESSPRRLGDHARPPHVVGERANLQPRSRERLQEVAARVEDRVNQGVVPQVGPPVVHVENGNVDHQGVFGRDVRALLHANIGEDTARSASRAVADAELLAVLDLVLAGDGHG